jgi:hypothetical protein
LWCHQILNKDGMAACMWYLHCCGNIIDILMRNSVYSALHFTDYLCYMYFSQKTTLYVVLQQLRTLLKQTLPLQLSASAKVVAMLQPRLWLPYTWYSISYIADTTLYYLITPAITLLIFGGASHDEYSVAVFLNFHN